MIPSAKASVPVDVVVAGRVDGGEHQRTSHPPETQHRALTSRKREVGVLGSVIVPSPGALSDLTPEGAHRSTA